MPIPVNLGLGQPQLPYLRADKAAKSNGDARVHLSLFTLVDAGQKGLFMFNDWD